MTIPQHKITITTIETVNNITYSLTYNDKDVFNLYLSVNATSFDAILSKILGVTIYTQSDNNNFLVIFIGNRKIKLNTTIPITPIQSTDIQSSLLYIINLCQTVISVNTSTTQIIFTL